VTQAYTARFKALGGVAVKSDALRLHQTAGRWRVDTTEGPIDAEAAVVALGPWAPDLLVPLGVKLPLAVKRGYHRHFRARGNASLARPILDAENGYCIVPMEQGIRITTGAEFAPRDAAPTRCSSPGCCRGRASCSRSATRSRRIPGWARPCFADSRPVIGRAVGLQMPCPLSPAADTRPRGSGAATAPKPPPALQKDREELRHWDQTCAPTAVGYRHLSFRDHGCYGENSSRGSVVRRCGRLLSGLSNSRFRWSVS
jgi:FAD dependent oxidoreductase